MDEIWEILTPCLLAGRHLPTERETVRTIWLQDDKTFMKLTILIEQDLTSMLEIWR